MGTSNYGVILRRRNPLPASTTDFALAWDAVMRTQKQLATEWQLVAQADHAALAGEMAELADQQQVRVTVQSVDSAGAKGVLADLGLADITELDDGASAVLGDRPPEQVVAALVAAGVGVRGFAVAKPRLEDVFVQLTGEGFDVSG